MRTALPVHGPPRRRVARPSPWITVVVALLLAVVGLLVLAALAERIAYRGDVLPGVRVGARDAGGTAERALRAQLERLGRDIETRSVDARAGEVALRAPARDAGVRVDWLATLAAARRAGRAANPLDALAGVVLRRLRNDRIALRVTFDPAKVDAVVERWAREARQGVRDADLTVTRTTVTVVPARAGTGIDRAETRRLLTRALLAPAAPPAIELRLGPVGPDVSDAEAARVATQARALLSAPYRVRAGNNSFTITPAATASALTTSVRAGNLVLAVDPTKLQRALAAELRPIGRPPVPATFRIEAGARVVIVPSQDGTAPDLAAMATAMLAGTRDITVGLVPSRPEHDTAWARSLRITRPLASFTTRHPCCAPRVTNIHTAADILDGRVIEPGQVFSLNGLVGPRTKERGFVEAPVYYEEGFTTDFGGGVSQLATTAFNAAWWAGFPFVEHQPHTLYFDRYPMGREATVNYPYLDLRWRNDSRNGVLVTTSYTDTSITVALWGDTEGRAVREVEGSCSVPPTTDTRADPRCIKVLSTTPKTTKLVPCKDATPTDDRGGICPSLRAGELRLVQPGYTGYVVEYFREIRVPGAAPARERFWWRYTMLPDVVLVGDRPAPGTTTTTTSATTATTTAATTPTARAPTLTARRRGPGPAG